MRPDYDGEKVLQGKIVGTKVLVKKQSKAVKETETKILELVDSEPENVKSLSDGDMEKLASLLRDFYICFENALGFIGHNFEKKVPSGEGANQILLDQMTLTVEKERPPVLDSVLKEEIQPYMQFRIDFDSNPDAAVEDKERIVSLLDNLKAVSATARQQLADFFEELNKFHGIK